MCILQIVSLAALAFCFVMLLSHFIRLVRLGRPNDASVPSGSVAKGVAYANTVAMAPVNKESAYLHLPTYAAGIAYHLGTFLCFLLYILSLFDVVRIFPSWLSLALGLCLCISALCGVMMLVKRLTDKNLHSLANPDDYLSNLFTTLFQCATALYLLFSDCCCATAFIHYTYYILCTVLFLYMPFSKLKHLLYYFSARYHIGFFYGWRNTWPPRKEK